MVRRPWTAEEVITRLDALAARWPEELMLFGGPGSLHLVTKAAYAQQGRDGSGDGWIPASGRLATFLIPTDGGDPTFDEEL